MSDTTVPSAADDAKKAASAAKKTTAEAAAKTTAAAKKTASTAKKTTTAAEKAVDATKEVVDSAKQSLAEAEVAAGKAAEATKDAAEATAAAMPAPVTPPAPAPIFVQAPAAPRMRGNRLTTGLIGVLAAVVFGALYFGFLYFIGAITGGALPDIVEFASSAFGSWIFWMPVIAFFLGFWILGAFINRGRWGFWVIFSVLVGFAAYGGVLFGAMMEAEFWSAPADSVSSAVMAVRFSPAAFIALVLGREVTVWFGALIAKIGARKQEQNAKAKKEYEDKLAAGPVLSR